MKMPFVGSDVMLRVSKHHALKLDELLLRQIFRQVAVWHGQLVACDVPDFQCPVHHVRILRCAKDVNAICSPSARQKKEVTYRNVGIATNNGELGCIALGQNAKAFAKH